MYFLLREPGARPSISTAMKYHAYPAWAQLGQHFQKNVKSELTVDKTTKDLQSL